MTATLLLSCKSGVLFNVIALYLGHETPATTHRYVEANLAMKEQALGAWSNLPRLFPVTGHLTSCAGSSRTCNYVKNPLAPAQASSGVGIGTSHSFELHIDTAM